MMTEALFDREGPKMDARELSAIESEALILEPPSQASEGVVPGLRRVSTAGKTNHEIAIDEALAITFDESL
jgi:hypothetical protein